MGNSIGGKNRGESKLTPKQQAFCDYYLQSGNATEAALKAGYSKRTARVIGQENLLKPAIVSYIKARQEVVQSHRIATETEIKEFWTGILRENENELKERLKASELLAKTKGMFLERNETTLNIPKIEIIGAGRYADKD